ncbi:DUF4230 domain-containing protein [Aquimarina sp. D1M17]|uniref:DUF4230 domain-containing protein n=1 Tax=Aquimarina acroporae TaxID=2937283 RepID=UPI0020BDF00D|nr:DUF4230 domain-containing protein [Aquimarina acroporae]MCK8521444.1 DUF4230 domain-containing protein [Aquimarina acroporae]
MRNFLLGALLMALLAFGIKYFIDRSQLKETELESSNLILTQMKNVGKLVVTEGHFAEVITYKDAKKYYLDMFTSQKAAVVVVNAKVQVSYDLSKIDYIINKDNKTVTITKIPEPEIDINPDIKYHSLIPGFLNKFAPKDHNTIRKKVILQLEKKVQTSSLITNSQNRLLSELQKIYILTNSLGWRLKYNTTEITDESSILQLID